MIKIATVVGCVALFFFFGSCAEKEKTIQKHKNLIGFRAQFLGEMGDDAYEEIDKLGWGDKITLRYLDDILQITTWEEKSLCGKWEGAIEIRNDTIFLDYVLLSDEICTSLSYDKLTYFIDNPNRQKWTVVK